MNENKLTPGILALTILSNSAFIFIQTAPILGSKNQSSSQQKSEIDLIVLSDGRKWINFFCVFKN
jgi:hypothetical protein